MRKRMLFQMIVVLAAALLAVAARAQEPTLKVGDPAPKLQVGKWVQGEPVKEFAPDKVYIVEFWATWCAPCRVVIPHLNELHEKLKDKGLVVIGQDVLENNESLVEPFVKKMGEKMTYRVALDSKSTDPQGAMLLTWLTAAGQTGIPRTFVVNKHGRIVWIGHPSYLKEKLVEDVLANRYDIAKARADYERLESNRKRVDELFTLLGISSSKKNWDAAEAALTELEKLLPEDMRSGLGMARFRILAGRHDYEAAYRSVTALSDAEPDNVMLQLQIAWAIATEKDLRKRDLALAEKIAERANKAARGNNANVLDTLARVQFMSGKQSQAIETQQKAVDAAEDQAKERFQKFLASYKQGKLPAVE